MELPGGRPNPCMPHTASAGVRREQSGGKLFSVRQRPWRGKPAPTAYCASCGS